MTVSELIILLQAMPQDAQVVVLNGDVHAPSACSSVTLTRANMFERFPEFSSDNEKAHFKQVVRVA
ncbi:hypothetical protein [Mesorhizobium sp. B2-1-2]|uniref:hypothetical protein n=1 Tax=Mesorhizobium sp. B2-1-2 TaxID=2589973 RepID=UPI00112A1AC0|nr:hypothetical protein [Mesorhizobium sp. B2-1-2]TPN04502.1 hypothetical protein FJ971_29595 [Mesorhizobium sp. B2-1-2]